MDFLVLTILENYKQYIMKKILLLFISLFMMVSSAFAAKITVHGTVLSSKGKTPIVGALISDKDSNESTTSDVDGNFVITVEAGSSLQITSLGYRAKSMKVKTDNVIVYLSTGKDRNYQLFYTVTAGLEYISESFKNNMSVGPMFGMYWKNWGWYAKLGLPIAFRNSERDALMGAVLTVGVVRNITNNFRVYLGTGFGLCMYGYYLDSPMSPYYASYYSYYDKDFEWEVDGTSNIGIPAEIGVQYNYKHLNLTAGFQYVFNTYGHLSAWRSNMSPYLGIGYTY